MDTNEYYNSSDLYFLLSSPSHIRELYDDNTNSQNLRLMVLIKTEIHLPRIVHRKEIPCSIFPLFVIHHLSSRLSEVVRYSEIMEEKTPMRVYLKWSEIKLGIERIGRLIAESLFSRWKRNACSRDT